MEKQEKILRKLNREITNMYNDGTLETDQFNELTDLTNKALTFCEVIRQSEQLCLHTRTMVNADWTKLVCQECGKSFDKKKA